MVAVAAEGLGANVDALVVAGCGNQEVVDAEAQGELSLVIAFDHDIAAVPFLFPGLRVGSKGSVPGIILQMCQPCERLAFRVVTIAGGIK